MAQAQSGLAMASADSDSPSGVQEIIAVVLLSGDFYGIAAGQVQEIVRMQEITEVPNAPSHVQGVINLRGRIVPVVDLRAKFGLPHDGHTDKTRIVIAEVTTGQGDLDTIGLIVDGVDEIRTINIDELDVDTPLVTSVDAAFIRGIVKLENRMVLLLDIDKAF